MRFLPSTAPASRTWQENSPILHPSGCEVAKISMYHVTSLSSYKQKGMGVGLPVKASHAIAQAFSRQLPTAAVRVRT
jgi:hypothetical protein